MSTLVISQPMLFPWSGFFEQMMLADIYYFLDDAQFSKGSFTNRIQIKIGDGIKWMTIPLAGKGSFQTISELQAASGDWRASHMSLLKQAFRAAPYAADALDLAERVYGHEGICNLLIASIELSADYLGISDGQMRARTSELNIDGISWQRVLTLTQRAGANRYLTGHGAASYLDHEAFERTGIAVEYMRYSRTPWPQAGIEFTPYVSILDLIANAGPAARSFLLPQSESWRTFLKRRISP